MHAFMHQKMLNEV